MPDFIDKIDLSGTYIPLNDDRLNTDIFTSMRGKNMVCFGDSWTKGTGSLAGAPPGATIENSRFTHAAAVALGMNEMNYAVGTSGFMRPLQTIDQVTAAVGAMTDQEKRDVKLAILVNGINDMRHTNDETLSDVLDQVQNVINTILNNFPNCYVLFGVDIQANGIDAIMFEWTNAMVEKALSISARVQYLNMANLLTARMDLYDTDTTHPNYNGHQAIGGLIVSSVLGGTSLPIAYMGTPTLDTGYTINGEGFQLFKVGPFMVLTPGAMVIASEQQQVGNRQIGTLPTGCGSPYRNLYGMIVQGNAMSGTICILQNRLYINTLTAAGSSFTPMMVWLPYY